jgi:hypothetical protein
MNMLVAMDSDVSFFQTGTIKQIKIVRIRPAINPNAVTVLFMCFCFVQICSGTGIALSYFWVILPENQPFRCLN